MSATAGDRIFSRGPLIKLHGKAHRIRFGFRALHYIEGQFGSLEAFMRKLGEKEGQLHTICLAMIAGLLHEKPADSSIEEFEAYVEGGLDESEDGLITWIVAIRQAVDEQWPAPSGRTLPKGRGKSTSPGKRSTSSPRSTSAARRRSSSS